MNFATSGPFAEEAWATLSGCRGGCHTNTPLQNAYLWRSLSHAFRVKPVCSALKRMTGISFPYEIILDVFFCSATSHLPLRTSLECVCVRGTALGERHKRVLDTLGPTFMAAPCTRCSLGRVSTSKSYFFTRKRLPHVHQKNVLLRCSTSLNRLKCQQVGEKKTLSRKFGRFVHQK